MEEKRSTITYDENWQDVTEPEYPVILEPSERSEEETKEFLPGSPARRRSAPKQLLLTIQLIVCILLFLAAFVIKGIGGEVYQNIREWYYTQLNHSAIFEKDRSFDFSALLRIATPDEAENQTD